MLLLPTLLVAGTVLAEYPRILEDVPLKVTDHPTITNLVHDEEARVFVYVVGDSEERLEVYDTSNPSNLTLVKSVGGPDCGCSGCVNAMALVGGSLLGVGCGSVVWSFDSTTLEITWRSGDVGRTVAVAADNDRVYVSTLQGVTILRASNLSVEHVVTTQAIPESAVPHGEVLYVSNGQLLTLDSRDFKVRFQTPGAPAFMEVNGGVLYGVSDDGLLTTYDVSDLSVAPVPLANLSIPVCRFAHGLQYSEGAVYVPVGTCGVQVVDVRNPATPKLGKSLVVTPETLLDTCAFRIHGNYGYVGTRFTGFYTAFMHPDITPSPPPPKCTVCGMGSKSCCDPTASPAQLCPGGWKCCDCGATACACP